MPRLDPRQRLLRDALVIASIASVVVAAAMWWALRVPQAQPLLASRTDAAAPPPAATPLPSASLWRPLRDGPVVTAAPAPPPPPAMRLISLSRRGERWVALIDPGDGSAAARVSSGDQVAGWQVDAIGPDAVELSSAGRHHQLKFGP